MIVNTAYEIQAKLLAGESEYRPNYIFVEFVNIDNTSNSIPQIPQTTVTADDTIDYYYSNMGEGRDYIAIPITIRPYSDDPTGNNKAAVYYSVVTSGITQGVNGTEFSSDKSIICGLGLVTRLDPNGTKDILFARTNLPPEKQLLKTTSDVYINWKIELK